MPYKSAYFIRSGVGFLRFKGIILGFYNFYGAFGEVDTGI